MLDWLRNLLSIEQPPCPTCEVLKEQLAIERIRFEKLLDKTINPPVPEPANTNTEHQPIRTGNFTPWRVKQQMLEKEERNKALQILQAKTEELEKEVLLPVAEVNLNG